MTRAGKGRGWGSAAITVVGAAVWAGCQPPGDADQDGDEESSAPEVLESRGRGQGHGHEQGCRGPVVQTPAALAVPADVALKTRVYARGQQIYACVGGAWVLKAPEANLLDERGRYLGNHFLGPTWQWRDGSKLVGARLAQAPAANPSADIAWLLLSASSGAGDGDGELSGITHIQRINTTAGVPPPGACTGAAEVRVGYEAEYLFYGRRDCRRDPRPDRPRHR